LYSITYHYDLVFYEVEMQTKRIVVYITNSTRLPYLDVKGTCISMDSTTNGWSYSRIASTSVTTCAIGSIISPCPQWVSPCLSVALSNIISLLIYPAAFCIIDVITCADWVILISSENITSRNRIWAQISTVSRRLQNILRICIRNIKFCRLHFYLSHLR